MGNELCHNCKYCCDIIHNSLMGDGPESFDGLCRKRSPKIASDGDAMFPRVTGSMWCGEWEPADTKRNSNTTELDALIEEVAGGCDCCGNSGDDGLGCLAGAPCAEYRHDLLKKLRKMRGDK